MPAAAAITVKKYDGTTDVVYNVLAGSPGDRQPAVFRLDAFAAIQGNRPVFTVVSKPSTDGSQRIIEWRLQYPELMTDSTTGVQSVRKRCIASGTFTLDRNCTDVTIQEAAAQSANLLKSTLMQAVLVSGFAPT